MGLARREKIPGALSGAVSLALAPLLSAAIIRNLADPAASLPRGFSARSHTASVTTTRSRGVGCRRMCHASSVTQGLAGGGGSWAGTTMSRTGFSSPKGRGGTTCRTPGSAGMRRAPVTATARSLPVATC